MRFHERLIAPVLLAIVLGHGPAQAAEPWQKLIYSDPRHPSVYTPVVTPLWKRELADLPFYQIHAVRVEGGGETYLISIAFGGGLCEMGANGRNAVAEPAICPVRVDVLQDGKVVRTARGKACSVSPLPEDETGNQADTTQIRFDPAKRSIAFRSLMNGKAVRTCQRTVRVP